METGCVGVGAGVVPQSKVRQPEILFQLVSHLEVRPCFWRNPRTQMRALNFSISPLLFILIFSTTFVGMTLRPTGVALISKVPFCAHKMPTKEKFVKSFPRILVINDTGNRLIDFDL